MFEEGFPWRGWVGSLLRGAGEPWPGGLVLRASGRGHYSLGPVEGQPCPRWPIYRAIRGKVDLV